MAAAVQKQRSMQRASVGKSVGSGGDGRIEGGSCSKVR